MAHKARIRNQNVNPSGNCAPTGKAFASRGWQINLQHNRDGTSNLVQNVLAEKSPTLTFVQEPHVSGKGAILGFPRSLRVTVGDELSPRAALISKDIDIWPCSHFSGRDVASALVSIDGTMVLVASVYLDCTVMEIPSHLVALCNSRGEKPILLGIDSNAHSTLWGYDVSNKRGELVEEFLAAHNLVVLNIGTENTFVPNRLARSIIDITVCSPELVQSIDRWRVNPIFQFSDHRRIEFEFNLAAKVPQTGWALRRADWTKFRQLVDSDADGWKEPFYWTTGTINFQAKRLVKGIYHALDLACPKTKSGTVGKKKITWWTSDLSLLRKQVRRAARLSAVPNADQSTLEEFRALRNKFKHMLKSAKRVAWQEFSEDLSSMTEMARFAKIVLRGKDRAVGLLKGRDGSFADSPDQTLEILMDGHFAGSVMTRAEDHPANPQLSRREINTSVFTPEKVSAALKSFHKFKAAGPDGLKPIVLHNLGTKATWRLTRIFQACYRLGYVPKSWRNSKVIFIPKVGKADYGEVRSFRPISLSNFTHKAMERLVGWHLEETVLKDNPISDNQHAFRKGRSTDTALGEAVDWIESSILRDKFVLGIFLDIEGAFDNLSTGMAIESMKGKGFPEDTINWYAYYLKNRTASIEIAGAKTKRHLTKGTPQGGVLSPLAWIVNFEGLLEILNQGPAKGVGYADDGMVMIAGSDPGTLVNLIQPILDQAAGWGRENGLKFSAAKTVAVMFTRKRKWDTNARPKMDGIEIPFSSNAKYLGVLMNSRLTWNDHVSNKIKKCKAKIMQIRAAVGIKWGPNPRLMLWAYQGIVVPALTYGSLVWGNRITNAFDGKFSKLNRLALVGLGPMRPSTPTAGLEIIANQPPLELRIREEGLKAYFRFSRGFTTKWDGLGKNKTKGYLRTWADIQKVAKIAVVKEDSIDPIFNWDKPFLWKDDIDECDSIDCILEFGKASFADEVHFARHTIIQDGIVVSQGGFKLVGTKVPQLINTMNIQDCCESLMQMSDRIPGKTVRFIVPNIPPQMGMYRVYSKTVSDCLESLRKIEFISTKKLTFNSVKTFQDGRSEICTTAMDAVKPGLETLQNRASLAPRGTNSSAVRNWTMNQWTKRWVNMDKCRQTKLWFPKPNQSTSRRLMSLGRRTLGLVIQFITGHGWLRRHAALIDSNVESDCRLCYENEETPWHLASECPAIANERSRIIQIGRAGQQISDEADLFPYAWTPEQLLRFLRVPQINELFDVQEEGEEKTVHHS